MDNEANRLASFFPVLMTTTYPLIKLAANGFYYDGNTTRCYRCSVSYDSQWTDSDIAILHEEKSSDCPLFHTTTEGDDTVIGLPTDNYGDSSVADIPIEHLFMHDPTNRPSNAMDDNNDNDVGTSNDTHTLQNTGNLSENATESSSMNLATPVVTENTTSYSTPSSPVETPSIVNNERHGEENGEENVRPLSDDLKKKLPLLNVDISQPVYKQYATYSQRITTFKSWPHKENQAPDDMAKAGMVYTGKTDRTVCFYCGGGLIGWEPHDKPAVEHARWFPQCLFLRRVYGANFITTVHDNIEMLNEPSFYRYLNGAYEKQSVDDDISKPTIRQEQTRDGDDDASKISVKKTRNDFRHHAAILSVHEMGYSYEFLQPLFDKMNTDGVLINASNLLKRVFWTEEGDENVNESESEKDLSLSNVSNDNDTLARITDDEQSCIDTENKVGEWKHERLVVTLEDKIEELHHEKLCKVCLDADSCILFLPCTHLATCVVCAAALRKCPCCRTVIQGTVKVIRS